MKMSTLEELDFEITAAEAEKQRLALTMKPIEEAYYAVRAEWCAAFTRVTELKRRRAVLAELLETYRGQDKLAV